MIFDLWMLCSV